MSSALFNQLPDRAQGLNLRSLLLEGQIACAKACAWATAVSGPLFGVPKYPVNPTTTIVPRLIDRGTELKTLSESDRFPATWMFGKYSVLCEVNLLL